MAVGRVDQTLYSGRQQQQQPDPERSQKTGKHFFKATRKAEHNEFKTLQKGLILF